MDDGSDVVKDVPDKGCDAPETTKKANCVLPPRLHVMADGFDTCSQAVALLKRTQPSILHSYVPVFVVGDGNCLFRAVSLACYGSEEYHDTLRQLAATEMLQHPQWYDAERVDIFSTLSDLLCGDVSCAELAGEAELVSGSDDEKAMVGALRHVFPNAEHVFCARRLEENVRRFLTDMAGMGSKYWKEYMKLHGWTQTKRSSASLSSPVYWKQCGHQHHQ